MDQEGSKGWIRLMYAYPTNFSEACIDAFAELSKKGRLLPYLDIPLQHASDNMLTAMKRNVQASQQEALINRLRERVPGMSIRTTFISGFPGETQQDHDELVSFVRRMKFEAVGVFEYSHEPGTVAGTMEDDPKLAVPAEVKKARRDEVMAAQQAVAFARAAEIASHFDERNPITTGKQFDVIIDAAMRSSGLSTSGVTKGGKLYAGRTYFQAPQIDAMTFVQSKEKIAPGEVVRCVIVGSDGYDLVARPVDEIEKKVTLKVMGR
jgi:ribosomal protein S12 methylthiotransferase